MSLTDSELTELIQKIEQSKRASTDLKPSEKKLAEDFLKNIPTDMPSNSNEVKAYLEKNQALAMLLKKQLDSHKANKTRADALMQVSANFNLAYDVLEPLSKLPLVGILVAPIRFACAYFEGKYVERAAKYNPDLEKLVKAFQVKYLAGGVGATETTLQVIAGSTFLVAFSPVILTGVAASLFASRLMTTGLAFKKAWDEWGNSTGSQRLGLIGGCLSNVGKSVLAAFAVVLGGVASSVSFGISTIVGTGSILLSTLFSSALAFKDIVTKWKKLPGETSAFARRMGMVSKFATHLAFAALMATLTVAAVAAVFNPIGLAVVGGTLLTVGIVTAAVAFAGFIGSWWSKRKEAKQKQAELSHKKVETKSEVEDKLGEKSKEEFKEKKAETDIIKELNSLNQALGSSQKEITSEGKEILTEKTLDERKHAEHLKETEVKEQKAKIEKSDEIKEEEKGKKEPPSFHHE